MFIRPVKNMCFKAIQLCNRQMFLFISPSSLTMLMTLSMKF